MLLEFSVKNFGPFKDKVTLSMVASNYDKKSFEESNVFETQKFNLRLLKSAAIIGANASGKSRIVEAMAIMKLIVNYSFAKKEEEFFIPYYPFLLDETTETAPTEFEIDFIQDNTVFHYGFSYDKTSIQTEWLDMWTSIRKTEVFKREGNKILFAHKEHFKAGKKIENEQMINEKALILSTAFEFKGPDNELTQRVKQWFNRFKVLNSTNSFSYVLYSYQMYSDEKNKKKLLEFLKEADICIEDIKHEEKEIFHGEEEGVPDWLKAINDILKKNIDFSKNPKSLRLKTIRKKVLKNGETGEVEFFLDNQESLGTRRFIELSGPIFDVIGNGGILVVDELDNSLHSLLAKKIISIFNSKKTNIKNSQLIFNSHNLESLENLRRDQVWMTEKNRMGVAFLFSLAEFKKSPRREESISKRYLNGRYGAVPFLEDFGNVFKTENEEVLNE